MLALIVLGLAALETSFLGLIIEHVFDNACIVNR